MTRNLCTCTTPSLYLERIDHVVKCSLCGAAARLELGKDRDPRDRVIYRAELNRHLEAAAKIERQIATGRKADKLQARKERARRIKQLHEMGYTYGQIAELIGVSTTTVKYWCNADYRKQKREAQLRWKADNPEASRASQSRTNEKRRDQQRAYARRWTRENPSRKRLNNLRSAARA